MQPSTEKQDSCRHEDRCRDEGQANGLGNEMEEDLEQIQQVRKGLAMVFHGSRFAA